MTIIIFGSINMDLVARVANFPRPGETLTGRSFQTVPGGKGANQAVACARLGATTRMIGRVGDDEFGKTLVAHMESEGVDCQGITATADQHSGVAIITIAADGENQIIIIPGANGAVGEAELARLDAALEGTTLLLLQLEVPLSIVQAAAELAQSRHVPVILDPAPAQLLPPALIATVDYLTPNTVEAEALTQIPIHNQDDAAAAANQLRAQGARCVLIKMGGQGVYVADDAGQYHLPALPVTAVDTVAAGDAFNAAMAVALSEGKTVETAVHWGLAAGAWAVTRPGAQAAMPTRNELLSLLPDQKVDKTRFSS